MRSGVTGETCKIAGVYKCMGEQVLTVELKAGESFPLHNTYGTVCWILRQRL